MLREVSSRCSLDTSLNVVITAFHTHRIQQTCAAHCTQSVACVSTSICLVLTRAAHSVTQTRAVLNMLAYADSARQRNSADSITAGAPGAHGVTFVVPGDF